MCCCTDWSAGKLLKLISIRSWHFTMDAYVLGSVCPRFISKLDLHYKTHSEPIQTAMKKRCLRLLRHVLRISPNRITRVDLRWTPQRKRKQGRLKATWQSTVEKEIKAMDLTLGEDEMVALDRISWRQRVEVSCSTRR